ncbi:MAG: hypothetical protein ABIZ49_08445 [Opitutaceae bacterium]
MNDVRKVSVRRGSQSAFRPRTRRGSVLIIVLVTLLFATFALIVFMDKASNDLLVEQREAQTQRLRREAYSALEVTLAVLEEFRQANNGLHSPAEGWNDPLAFASYTPTEDRTVDIAFEDESGKISLPRANLTALTLLFKNWQLPNADAEALADALLGWMKPNHVYTTGISPDYEHGDLPFEAPARSLRSLQELIAIDKVRDVFFDEGRPNELWKRFADSVSLLDFQRSNINGGRPDTLAALGQFDETQQKHLADYISGTGAFERQGPGFFQSPAEVARIAGLGGDTSAFNSQISALRIKVTVHDGRAIFSLAAVVAPPNGATTIQTTASQQRAQGAGPGNSRNATAPNRPNAAQANNATAGRQGGNPNASSGANARNLRYPFTLLEIRENDEIPSPPLPPLTEKVI